MKLRHLIPVSAAMLLTVVGCENNKNDLTKTTETKTTSANATVAPVNPAITPQVPVVESAAVAPTTVVGTLASDDKDFLTKAAQGGMLEVKLAETAKTRATGADVKMLGTHISTDHMKANTELATLAAKKGVTLPSELDKDHKKKIEDLEKLSGAKFDKEYSDAMVKDHEEDVKLFEKTSKDAKDPDIRAYAAKTLPTLQGHLAMAKDAKAKTK